jgi:hypothetical protein
MTDSEKIQWLVDREHIKETIYRYPVGIDTGLPPEKPRDLT